MLNSTVLFKGVFSLIIRFPILKRTLKEYMAFLCASDLIELVSGQTYRRKQVSIVPQTEGEAFARDEEAMKHALLLFRNEQSATSAAEKNGYNRSVRKE
ncbi:hypothetical protein GCM10020331_078280 [Ectobacillus funiculus]